MAGRETALRDKPLEEEEEGKEEEKINAARSDCKVFRPLESISLTFCQEEQYPFVSKNRTAAAAAAATIAVRTKRPQVLSGFAIEISTPELVAGPIVISEVEVMRIMPSM